MKKIILTAVVLLSFRVLQAQSTDSTRTQTPRTTYTQTTVQPGDEADLYTTRAEKFSDSAGALIQKEYIRVGNILGCVIQVVHYTDLINGAKVSALRFSDAMGKVAILDEDEIGALAISMKIIKEKSWTPLPPTTPKPFSGAGAASKPALTSKEAGGSPT
ncbi:hypothetical protein ACQ86N_38465 [Puia sp. P3]|uniref:hypothetical protein n=1 Tax=Puia sp. P3 TaxID=3423952 RepID=UPI003D676345